MEYGFLTPLRVESIDDKNWLILEDFCWRGKKGDLFTVYKGERTDFATVPWWSQIITPRTGTWTKAAALHDKMCNLLNEFHKLLKEREKLIVEGADPADFEPIYPPPFSSIDTDAIFRKNARDGGTGPIRSEILWFGVRCGALSAPRRDGWINTFPRWFADLLVILAILAVVGYVLFGVL